MHSIILQEFSLSLLEAARVWVQKHWPESLEAIVKPEEYVEADMPQKDFHRSTMRAEGRKIKEQILSNPWKGMQEAHKGASGPVWWLVTNAVAKDI